MSITGAAASAETEAHDDRRSSMQSLSRASASGRHLLNNARNSITRMVQARESARTLKEQQKQQLEMDTNRVRTLLLGQSLWQSDAEALEMPGMFSIFVESVQYSAPPIARVQSWVPQSRRPTMHAAVLLLPGTAVGRTDNLVMMIGGDLATASEEVVKLATTESSGSMRSSIRSIDTTASGASVVSDTTEIGALGIAKERKKKNRTRPPVTRRVSSSLRSSFRQFTSAQNQVDLAWTGQKQTSSDPLWTPIVKVQLVKQSSATKKDIVGETAVEVGSLFVDSSKSGIWEPAEKSLVSPLLMTGALGKLVGYVHMRVRWTPAPPSAKGAASKSATKPKEGTKKKKKKKVTKKKGKNPVPPKVEGAAGTKPKTKTKGKKGKTKAATKKTVKASAAGDQEAAAPGTPDPNEQRILLGIGQGMSAKPGNVKVVSSAKAAVDEAMNKPKVRLATIWRDDQLSLTTKEPEAEQSGAPKTTPKPTTATKTEELGQNTIHKSSAKSRASAANDRWQLQGSKSSKDGPGHMRTKSNAIDALNLEAKGDNGSMRERVDTKHTTWTDWGPPDPATPVFRDGWTRFLDEKRGIHYWYHDEKGTSWKRPKGWVVSSRSNYADTLESDWIEEFSSKYQKPYWFNTATGESVWVKPADAP